MNLVPGFLNYTENNCKYALRQWQANQAIRCHVVTLPYQGYIEFKVNKIEMTWWHCWKCVGTLPSCRPNLLVMLASKAFVNQVGFKEYSDPMFSKKVGRISKISRNNSFQINEFLGDLDCVSECIKEIYSFTATYAELQLSTNFMFGNKTLHFNQRSCSLNLI